MAHGELQRPDRGRRQTGEARTPAEDVRPDHDEIADALGPASVAAPAPPTPSRAEDDILAFPRGAAAGDCLHRMFELADFTDPRTWPDAIRGALRERPAPAAPELAARLPAMMHNLIADVVAPNSCPAWRWRGSIRVVA